METNRIKLMTALLCGFFSTAAAAEKWYWEPVFSARAGYDDNIRLESSEQESAFNAHLVGDARFGFRTEVSDVKFQTLLGTHQYDGADDLDYNEALFGMESSLRHNLDTFGLDASLHRDSSRTSELDTTGSVNTSIPRIKGYISPSWSRQLSEKSLLRLSYAYTNVDYQNKPGTNLTDYRYQLADIGLIQNLSETTTLQATLIGSHYKADGTSYAKTETLGFQIGLSRRFSETLNVSVALGLSDIDTFFINPITRERDEDNDLAPLVAISFDKAWEKTSLTGSLLTTQSPSSEGRLLTRNSVSLVLKHKLSERLNFALDGVYYDNETAGSFQVPGDTRTYLAIEPKLSWRASRWWTVSGSYRYRTQEYTERGDGPADSNAVYLTVQYIWPRPSYARWMEL